VNASRGDGGHLPKRRGSEISVSPRIGVGIKVRKGRTAKELKGVLGAVLGPRLGPALGEELGPELGPELGEALGRVLGVEVESTLGEPSDRCRTGSTTRRRARYSRGQ
jgi:hypothetical protein